jgi:polysaccharide export outer membrane protein
LPGLWLIALVIALAGCATKDPLSTQSIASAALVDQAGEVAITPDYRIAPKDVLDVVVFRVPDLSATVTVNPAGYIQLPLTGQVLAAGKTVGELKTTITGKLTAYLQSPAVSVSVKDAASQRVTIQGAVAKPGVYPADGSTTLLQIVAMAGGLDRIADSRGVVVLRNVDGKRQAAKFDFNAISRGSAEDPPIFGGDVIVVDESGAKAALRVFRESVGLFGFFVPFL